MTAKVTKDKLWKGIIEDCFEDFFRFFYPKWADEVDFSKGVEFLDKELDQLMPEAASSKRYVDKLVKIYLKSGEQQWILNFIRFYTSFKNQKNILKFETKKCKSRSIPTN